jgi:hypothetical protein
MFLIIDEKSRFALIQVNQDAPDGCSQLPTMFAQRAGLSVKNAVASVDT